MFSGEAILNRLRQLKKNDPRIHSIFIRHSAAHQELAPLISDCDVTVFTYCKSDEDYRIISDQIRRSLRRGTHPRLVPLDILIFPASRAAFALCQRSYYFRSVYPFRSWRNIESSDYVEREVPSHTYPLDHFPELSLDYYIIPRLLGTRRQRPLEKAFINRKLGTQKLPNSKHSHIGQYLAFELAKADDLYKGVFNPIKEGALRVGYIPLFNECDFGQRLGLCMQRQCFEAITDLHLYPNSTVDERGYVAIQTRTDVNPDRLLTEIHELQKIEDFSKFRVLLGTAVSTRGRLEYLSRNNIFEPFLYSHQGISLFSHEKLSLTLPGRGALRIKFEEFLLCTLVAVSEGGIPGYKQFELCLAMHQAMEDSLVCFDANRYRSKYQKLYKTRSEYESIPTALVFFRLIEELFSLKFFEFFPVNDLDTPCEYY